MSGTGSGVAVSFACVDAPCFDREVQCPACAFENPSGARFCGSCGRALGALCRECGSPNPVEYRFCATCGAKLDEETGAAPTEERKVVSVLFADLVGFTGRAERLDPEDVRAVLAPYYARLRREIERYGGTVEKFIGDAVMALFGAPVAHEDDPERAVRAALAIRDAIGELNEADPKLDLHTRIGIATGEVVVVVGARPSEGEGMATGDVVNTAARLQENAPVDGILVTEATYRPTAPMIEFERAEPVRGKGKKEPIIVWEAIAARSRLGVEAVGRGVASLVGRTAELNALREAFKRACTRRSSQLVTLVGVPGIGKSRLVSEFFNDLSDDPDRDLVYWRQGRSLPYGEGVTYWALAEMMKAHAGVLETDAADAAAEKLRTAVDTLFPDIGEARWVEAALRPLLGLGDSVEPGPERRAEAFPAWRRFFEALADRRPLILVFEDLHWADDGLLDFVDHLVDWTPDAPIFVLATARPALLERRTGWGGGKQNAATISLPPLSDAEVGALVADLLGPDTPDGMVPELLARAGGNPLYAEEYTRMLRDPIAAHAPLPESVHGIIAARLDGLPPDEKSLLQDAAVVGRGFWVGALETITGAPRWSIEERLQKLVRKEFVRRERRTTVAGEPEFSFRHVLVADVAYGQIPRAARAEKHRLAAEWIDSLAADRPEDHAEMLAHHYVSALELATAAGSDTPELSTRTREVLRDAGDRASALNAFDAAARFYAQALELGPLEADEEAALLLRYGSALFYSRDAGGDVLSRAGELLLEGGDVEGAAGVETMLAWFDRRDGRGENAVRRVERADALVRAAPPSRAKAFVLMNVSRYLMVAEEYERSLEVGAEALALADRFGLDDLRAHVLATRGVARTGLGDHEGIEDLERAIRLAEERGAAEAMIRAQGNLASVVANMGDLARSYELQAAARAAANRFGIAAQMLWFVAEEMQEHFWLGRWDDAERIADDLIHKSETGASTYWEPLARVVRGHIRLAQGHERDALLDAERAVAFAREVGDSQILYAGVAFAARALVQVGNAERASPLISDMFSTWTSTGVVYALPDLAVAAHDVGRSAEFLAVLDTIRLPSRWVDAMRAFVAGAYGEAARTFATIGALPDEAYARLRAAEALAADGRQDEARVELEPAMTFYGTVGAAAYMRRGEALLTAPTALP